MNFRQKHEPASINDLVFRDPLVAQVISQYATGQRTKHLLLEGPTSTGKSEAARMILKERLFATMGPAYSSIYHGQGFNAAALKQIEGDWNIQMMTGWAYSVIDEVDYAGSTGCRDIARFTASKAYGTMIFTTNNPNKLDASFISRCYVLKVEPPLPTDWHQRGLTILQSEGHAVTLALVQTLFANFTGHARDFMDLVEDAHLRLLGNRSAAASRAQVHAANQPALVGVKIHNTMKPKVNVNRPVLNQAANIPAPLVPSTTPAKGKPN
jgi:replication factor C subunit 3/5